MRVADRQSRSLQAIAILVLLCPLRRCHEWIWVLGIGVGLLVHRGERRVFDVFLE